jgi:hypothetical protein
MLHGRLHPDLGLHPVAGGPFPVLPRPGRTHPGAVSERYACANAYGNDDTRAATYCDDDTYARTHGNRDVCPKPHGSARPGRGVRAL